MCTDTWRVALSKGASEQHIRVSAAAFVHNATAEADASWFLAKVYFRGSGRKEINYWVTAEPFFGFGFVLAFSFSNEFLNYFFNGNVGRWTWKSNSSLAQMRIWSNYIFYSFLIALFCSLNNHKTPLHLSSRLACFTHLDTVQSACFRSPSICSHYCTQPTA